MKKYHQWIGLAMLSCGLIQPTWANTEDELGIFLEQNFPTVYATDNPQDDPIRAFANQLNNHSSQPLKTNYHYATQTNYPNSNSNDAFQNSVNTQFGSSFGANAQQDAPSFSFAPMLNARSALIMNANTGKIVYQKNMDTVRSIASISKLMAAMVILDANLDMNEIVTITPEEIDRLKGTGSRLSIGTSLKRSDLMHLGLMSSENRAIHALGRTYPGGMSAFVAAMNEKARSLGMVNTRFYEPTGLDPRNVSTARDLSLMVRAANLYPQIRNWSTSNYGSVYTSTGRFQDYKNTNSLVREGSWDISLQKTGYIREAGRSMVMQVQLSNQPMVIVVLGSSTSNSRVNDARTLSTMIYQTPL